jgi:hypothetical protein
MIAELQRFRQKYPDYGDLDDAALASRLATKYPEAYGDLPSRVAAEAPQQGLISDVATEAGKGVASAVAGQGRALGGAIRWVGSAVGSDSVRQLGEEMADAYGRGGQRFAPEVGDYRQALESPRDAMKYVAHGVASGLTSSVPALAVGAVGGLPAAAAVNLMTETGSIMADQKDEGLDSPGRALVYGSAAAALDTVSQMLPLRYVPGLEKLRNLPLLSTPAGANWFVRGAKEAFKEAGAEGVTEFAQTLLERGGAGKSMTSPEALREATNAGIIGGLSGGAMGGAAGSLGTKPAVQPGTATDLTSGGDLDQETRDALAAARTSRVGMTEAPAAELVERVPVRPQPGLATEADLYRHRAPPSPENLAQLGIATVQPPTPYEEMGDAGMEAQSRLAVLDGAASQYPAPAEAPVVERGTEADLTPFERPEPVAPEAPPMDAGDAGRSAYEGVRTRRDVEPATEASLMPDAPEPPPRQSPQEAYVTTFREAIARGAKPVQARQFAKEAEKDAAALVEYDAKVAEFAKVPRGAEMVQSEQYSVEEGVQPTGMKGEPRVYYRGTNPNSTEKISTGDDAWDANLFVTESREGAKMYGGSNAVVERVTLKPEAKILREGTPEFRKLIRPWRTGNMLSWASDAVAKAKAAGYDGIHFQRQTDLGTAIWNQDAIEAREKDEQAALPAKGAPLDTDAIGRIRQALARSLPAPVTLRTPASIPNVPKDALAAHGVAGGRAAGLHGVVALPDGELRDVIMLAMDTATEETGYHELFHAAERLGVLTAEDLAVLDRRYPAGRKTAGETRADAYGRWKTGDKTNIPPVVARIFQKIREFFERAGNALRGLGYRSAADVFADLDSGKLADPKRRQITRSADLGRKLDADEWINGITVEQAVRMVRDGKGTEVAGHVLEGVRKGNITIAEAEDTIINAAMADPRFRLRKPELAEAAKKLVAEGIEELRAGINPPEVRAASVVKLTETPAFKKWFGKSKVVDENGEPLVVYKGMYPYDWTKETPDGLGPEIEIINRTTEFPAFNGDEPGIRIAGFFGAKETANNFASWNGAAMYPVYLSLQNPYTVDAKGGKAGDIQFGKTGKAFRDAMRSGKYDGAIIRNTVDEGDIYVAARPEQIKSVFNRGTYDSNDPRINYSLAADPSPVAQPAAQSLRERAHRLIDRFDAFATSSLKNLPNAVGYNKRRNLVLGLIDRIDTETSRLYNLFRDLTPDDAKAVFEYLTTRDGTTDSVQNRDLATAAEEAKKMIEDLGDRLVSYKIIPKSVIDAHRGEYLPRFFLQFLIGPEAMKGLSAGKVVSSQGYTKARRWGMSAEERIARGEITDPAYLISRAYSIPMRDMAILDWLQDIARHTEWVLPKSLIEWTWESDTRRKVGSATYRANEDGTYDVSVAKQTPKVYTHKAVTDLDALLGPKLAEAVRAGKGKALRRKTGTSPRAGRAQYQETGEVRLGHIWYKKHADGSYTVKVREMVDASTDHRGVKADALSGLVGEKRGAAIAAGKGKAVGGQFVTPHWLSSEIERISKQMALQGDAEREVNARTLARMQEALDAHGHQDFDHKQWKPMPTGKRYGPLAGMIVRKEIYDDIVGNMRVLMGDENWVENLRSHLETATGKWKWLKVTLNVAGQVRNGISNLMVVGMSGTDWHKIFAPYGGHPPLIVQTLREMRTNGVFYKQGMDRGFGKVTWSNVELSRIETDLLDVMKREGNAGPLVYAKSLMGKLYNTTGDWYQNVETFFKLLRFIDNMQNRGMTADMAAIDAHEVLIDYSAVKPWVKTARRVPLGMPFVTYTLKVAPVIMRSLVDHPAHSAPILALSFALPYLIAAGLDVDKDDYDKLMEAMPKWIREKGHVYLWPVKGDDGRWTVVDLGYFFPWSAWTEAFGSAYRTVKDPSIAEVGKMLNSLGVGGAPLYDIIAAWETGIDPFTQRPIVDPYGTPGEKLKSRLLYAWNMATPSMVNLGGRGALGKAIDAVSGTPDRAGRPKASLAQAGGSLLGVNTYSYDPVETRAQNLTNMEREAQDTESALKRRLANPANAGDEEALIRYYVGRIDRIFKEMGEYAEASDSTLLSR